MRVFVEVGSLREAQLTGIGQTVAELAKCALNDNDEHEYRFIVGGSAIPREIVEESVSARSGNLLGAYLVGGFANGFSIDVSGPNIGVFLHRVSLPNTFDRNVMIVYDLTPMLCPQYHTANVVNDFRRNFIQETIGMDRLVTISNAVKLDLISYFPEYRDRAVTSLCGISAESFSSDLSLLPKNLISSKYFLSLGTIEPRKNNISILRMLSRHKDLLESYRFVFAGRLGWDDAWQHELCELGLGDFITRGRILIADYVSESVKRALLKGCSGLIYPSHYEGFGLPVIEAFALGIPVICRRSSSLPEVGGIHAYYFNSSQEDGLFQALQRCIVDQLEFREVRAAQYIAHARQYRWSRLWSDIKVNFADWQVDKPI